MTPEAPKTLLDAVRYYTDPKVTFQTMIAVKCFARGIQLESYENLFAKVA